MNVTKVSFLFCIILLRVGKIKSPAEVLWLLSLIYSSFWYRWYHHLSTMIYRVNYEHWISKGRNEYVFSSWKYFSLGIFNRNRNFSGLSNRARKTCFPSSAWKPGEVPIVNILTIRPMWHFWRSTVCKLKMASVTFSYP